MLEARNYFVNSDQTRKDDSVDDVASGIQLNHYETRDNNPGVVDIGIVGVVICIVGVVTMNLTLLLTQCAVTVYLYC